MYELHDPDSTAQIWMDQIQKCIKKYCKPGQLEFDIRPRGVYFQNKQKLETVLQGIKERAGNKEKGEDPKKDKKKKKAEKSGR